MAETLVRQAGVEELPSRAGWRTAVAVVAATGFVALCAHIAIPLGFTPVPLSMAPFAVLLLGLLFSPRAGFAALALYLAEGAAGLPVFSPHAPGGLVQLLGPTGGYLFAYPLAAALAGSVYRSAHRGLIAALLGASAASILILSMGAAWLAILTHAHLSIVFAQAVIPFLPGDLLKVIAAAACIRIFDSFRPTAQRPAQAR